MDSVIHRGGVWLDMYFRRAMFPRPCSAGGESTQWSGKVFRLTSPTCIVVIAVWGVGCKEDFFMRRYTARCSEKIVSLTPSCAMLCVSLFSLDRKVDSMIHIFGDTSSPISDDYFLHGVLAFCLYGRLYGVLPVPTTSHSMVEKLL
jgi:hypothetical protein